MDIQQRIEQVYREESRRVFASLVRLIGDFDLAEEALHEAFAAAVNQWERDGIPNNPRAWLVSAGRFKAIDAIRRKVRFDASLEQIAARMELDAQTEVPDLEDDRLRLIFVCCHPALPANAQVPMTLREVCGLTTEEIAAAFLSAPAAIAQRIVRAKAKIRSAKIPFEVPERTEIPERLATVLSVIYLVFNEGYSASHGPAVTRAELSLEAIRLGRLLFQLHPAEEARGLLALMLLQESRRIARTTAAGDLVLLEEQDRTLWNREFINEGLTLLQSGASGSVSDYTIQAAIAAEHAIAQTAAATRWNRIVDLYNLLLLKNPSPVVELNRAVAIAMSDGPEAGLQLINELLQRGELERFHLAHAARADLYRRIGDRQSAKQAYLLALELVQQEPERRFLERRLHELGL